MAISQELLKAAKKAESLDEVKALAKENGFSISDEKLEKLYNQYHCSNVLSDEQLDQVSGGSELCDTNVSDWAGCKNFEHRITHENYDQCVAQHYKFNCWDCTKHYHAQSICGEDQIYCNVWVA